MESGRIAAEKTEALSSPSANSVEAYGPASGPQRQRRILGRLDAHAIGEERGGAGDGDERRDEDGEERADDHVQPLVGDSRLIFSPLSTIDDCW